MKYASLLLEKTATNDTIPAEKLENVLRPIHVWENVGERVYNLLQHVVMAQTTIILDIKTKHDDEGVDNTIVGEMEVDSFISNKIKDDHGVTSEGLGSKTRRETTCKLLLEK